MGHCRPGALPNNHYQLLPWLTCKQQQQVFAQTVVLPVLTHSPPNLLLQGILLVYDVSDKKSFKAVERWLTCVREVRQMASWQLCDDDLAATASLIAFLTPSTES